MTLKHLIIIGGGASGFFLSSNIKTSNWNISLLEQSKNPLQKLKISGGGRCNVTNACYKPKDLIKNYPRGNKELLSLFSKFQPLDTFQWFEKRGIHLKIENDSRVFPDTNSSQTIIDTLLSETKKNNVVIHYETTVLEINYTNNKFEILTNKDIYYADAVVIATGSSKKIWNIIEKLGHKIIPPVPSLFTFNCNHPLIKNLQGISLAETDLNILNTPFKERGPLLITHWGLSGPAILKLSSWAARYLADLDYKFQLRINWITENFDDARELLTNYKNAHPKMDIYNIKIYNLPQRFWLNLLNHLNIIKKPLFEISKKEINRIAESLTNSKLDIIGKSTFKNEFVTCGGVDLKEIDFNNMQSKLIPNLFFTGEVLNIDAITGGFNFQACWSESYILSKQFN
ncbi:NAD(P)/FAD-dependent oxidoreductase [Apibacter muscae]|nr:NAD(P)/FAD-dependent oxidoreductase [Apibacter muscae]